MNTLPNSDLILAIAVVILGATGTAWLLPHGRGKLSPRMSRYLGGSASGLALLLLAVFWTPPGPLIVNLFFYVFALAAVGGAVLMVTSREPMYSALWFASVVLSTSGLFLLAGAQFLAAGTVIVYAGAIIVTFLFVIMLAQMDGKAAYDRSARSPFAATASCYLLFWALLYALLIARLPASGGGVVRVRDGGEVAAGAGRDPRLMSTRDPSVFTERNPNASIGRVLAAAKRPTAALERPGDPTTPHVAGLGGTLFADHLATVEIAGALLFVALVGALAIATPKAPIRPGQPQPDSTSA